MQADSSSAVTSGTLLQVRTFQLDSTSAVTNLVVSGYCLAESVIGYDRSILSQVLGVRPSLSSTVAEASYRKWKQCNWIHHQLRQKHLVWRR